MNKKVLMDFGVGVLTVVVGMAVYTTVMPMIKKSGTTAPMTEA